MSFADKGIRANKKTRDGKKYFSAKSVAITDVLNVPITVVDFEAGIKTSKGDDRYAVLIIKDGEQYKFIPVPSRSRMCWSWPGMLRRQARRSSLWRMSSSGSGPSVMANHRITLKNNRKSIAR